MWGKSKHRIWNIVWVGVFLGILAGCSQSNISWTHYQGAFVESSFPIPEEVKDMDTIINNSKMNYVRYELPGIESSTLPETYLQEIKNWGWKQQQESVSEGKTNLVFIQGDRTLQLVLQKNYLTVIVPDKSSRAPIAEATINP